MRNRQMALSQVRNGGGESYLFPPYPSLSFFFGKNPAQAISILAGT